MNIVKRAMFMSFRISANPRQYSGYFPRESRDLSYGVIDKHVSTPTSSFFGTMMMEVNFLLVAQINNEINNFITAIRILSTK